MTAAARTARMRAAAALVAMLALAILSAAPSAVAAQTAAVSVPGPSSLFTGFVDDPLFVESPNDVRSFWLGMAHYLGSSFVRISASWSFIAPYSLPRHFHGSDPNDRGYHWTSLDETVRDATAQGENPVLMLWRAPSWAQGRGFKSAAFAGTWLPDAHAYGEFVHAVALRYSGHFPDPLHRGASLPRVKYYQAWNEPNLRVYLEPQWTRAANGSFLPTTPGIYRSLLNAAYSAVKSVHSDSYLLAAGTGPYGDPPGVDTMTPIYFLRELFCLSSNLRPRRCHSLPHFDALDHHPYTYAPTVHAKGPDEVSVPDLGKIWRVLHAAERLHHALPVARKSLWITEIDWGSNPPDPLNIPLARQARYLSLVFYEFWIQGVSHASWFLLRDPPYPDKSFTGAGLYFRDSTQKPSALAYRFPFVALPGPHQELTLWGKAPASGTVVIEKQAGTQWQAVAQIQTTAGGIFYARRRLGAHLKLRARLGYFPSPVWDNS